MSKVTESLSIADLLFKLRTEKRLTLRWVAQQVGISQKTLALIERGEVPITLETGKKLAEYWRLDAAVVCGLRPAHWHTWTLRCNNEDHVAKTKSRLFTCQCGAWKEEDECWHTGHITIESKSDNA